MTQTTCKILKYTSNHIAHDIHLEPVKRGLQTRASREGTDIAVREESLATRKQHLTELRMKTETADEQRAQAENALVTAQKVEATAREKTTAALSAQKAASVRF